MPARRAYAKCALMLVGLCLGTAPTGCGDPNGAIAVDGTVTYNGKPVVGEIQFVPEEGSTRSATGILDASGHFRLSSFRANDGAVPGKYKVAIVSKGPDKPLPTKMKGRMMEEDMQGTGEALIPKKFFNAETSGITAEVSSGTRTFTFDLKD